MILCVCHGISDREVRSLIENGATNVRDISTQCGAGTDCGACVRDLRLMTLQKRRLTKQRLAKQTNP